MVWGRTQPLMAAVNNELNFFPVVSVSADGRRILAAWQNSTYDQNGIYTSRALVRTGAFDARGVVWDKPVVLDHKVGDEPNDVAIVYSFAVAQSDDGSVPAVILAKIPTQRQPLTWHINVRTGGETSHGMRWSAPTSLGTSNAAYGYFSLGAAVNRDGSAVRVSTIGSADAIGTDITATTATSTSESGLTHWAGTKNVFKTPIRSAGLAPRKGGIMTMARPVTSEDLETVLLEWDDLVGNSSVAALVPDWAAPVVDSVSPSSVSSEGSTRITVSGSNFHDGATVLVGAQVCADVAVVSQNELTCLAPPHRPGTAAVTVENRDAHSGSLAQAVVYSGEAQVPVGSCAPIPQTLALSAQVLVLRKSCVTNAGQVVSVSVHQVRATRGDVSLWRLVNRHGNTYLRTFGTPVSLTVTWSAPATKGYEAYRVVKTYSVS